MGSFIYCFRRTGVLRVHLVISTNNYCWTATAGSATLATISAAISIGAAAVVITSDSVPDDMNKNTTATALSSV